MKYLQRVRSRELISILPIRSRLAITLGGAGAADLTHCQFQIDETPLGATDGETLVDEIKSVLNSELAAKAQGDGEAGVFVRADQTVDVQYIVYVIDAVNQLNKELGTKHKVVLGTTQPQVASL